MQANINANDWYEKSRKRWQNEPIAVSAVAGNFEGVHESDVQISINLLQDLVAQNRINTHYALDCGAGIGRVSENVLSKFFSLTDLVERDIKYAMHCKKHFEGQKNIRNVYNQSLQNFKAQNKYDVIWAQWCLEELKDEDLVDFLLKCKEALSSKGVIVVKENIISDGREFWMGDHQKIRSDNLFKKIFEYCGLKIEKHLHQKDNKKEILDVSCFVLSPVVNS